MNNFTMHATVCEMGTFKEFADEFAIGRGDLILTERFLHDGYMKNLRLSCDYLFYGDYRTGEPNEDFFDQILGIVNGMPQIKRIVGVGGGSILDTAKLLCFKEIKSPHDYFEKKLDMAKDKMCICIPTTCGTGSEMDGIIAGEMKVKGKIGLGLPEAIPDQAVLIPALLEKLPFKPFMFCSADALIHCMETSVSPTAHPFSIVYANEGIRLIVDRYIRIREKGEEERLKYLPDFLRASAYGGICLSHGPCGASHAMAHHFGSTYHVSHGESNAMFVAPTFKFYVRRKPEGGIADMARVIARAAGKEMDAGETFNFLAKLLSDIVPMQRLSAYGVDKEKLPGFADRVVETQQRLLVQSYIVPMTRDDLIEIYTDML